MRSHTAYCSQNSMVMLAMQSAVVQCSECTVQTVIRCMFDSLDEITAPQTSGLGCRVHHQLVSALMAQGQAAAGAGSILRPPTQPLLVSTAVCGWHPLPLSEPHLACIPCFILGAPASLLPCTTYSKVLTTPPGDCCLNIRDMQWLTRNTSRMANYIQELAVRLVFLHNSVTLS